MIKSFQIMKNFLKKTSGIIENNLFLNQNSYFTDVKDL